jgi:hypothetical protein
MTGYLPSTPAKLAFSTDKSTIALVSSCQQHHSVVSKAVLRTPNVLTYRAAYLGLWSPVPLGSMKSQHPMAATRRARWRLR